MSKIGFRLIRGVAILFALFVGFSADVVPTAWQSSTIVSRRRPAALPGLRGARPGTRSRPGTRYGGSYY
jgi:hypothetical protein